MKTTETIYQRALRLFGQQNQVDKAIEEAAEFIVAAQHRRIGRPDSMAKFAEEVADAEVMMAQMRLLTPPGLVDKFKAFKLKRLAGRLSKAEARMGLKRRRR